MLTANLEKQLRDFKLNIDLTVNPGEVLILLGTNGSGKSTVLNLLSGLLEPDDGEIVLNGHVVFNAKQKIFSPPEERNIGYVFQNYALFPHMSVFDNIAYGLKMRKIPKEQIVSQIQRTLEDLEIAHVRNERVTNLSGGQRQRVALARALIVQPHLLLLDEPLTALDPMAREKIRLELREQLVTSSHPAIMVTHSIKDAQIIGDRVIILEKGTVIWKGKPDELESGTSAPNLSHLKCECFEYRDFGGIAID
ncbi:ABC transporter ATP-binding protein [Methanospirillum lacunae]|uniref:Molybdate/tungstate import ATP-binding protein WtpC n=1 Tax=Methanospirillum lacunae TaxID=668570 RepID=A0A2V2N7T0_9EURY|nr:ABC transporter ATP-binding protein [Methanospirillum lacunae]PWR71333.1 ABC transporter [Methanospirillum lacunae]